MRSARRSGRPCAATATSSRVTAAAAAGRRAAPSADSFRKESYCCGSWSWLRAAGDRGHDGDGVAGPQGGLAVAQASHVLAVDEDAHVAAQPPVLVAQARADAAV